MNLEAIGMSLNRMQRLVVVSASSCFMVAVSPGNVEIIDNGIE